MLARLVCCVGLSVLVCGCSGNISSESEKCAPCTAEEIIEYENKPATDSSLKGRLIAAQAINVPKIREDALAGLAIDAAKAGNASKVKRALSHMRVPKRRNAMRSSCAFHLAMAGKSHEAFKIAKKINVPSLRNESFKRIATLK